MSSSGETEIASWREPVEVLPWHATLLRAISPERLVWAFVLAGLVARCLRFLYRSPLWPDEGFLAASYLDRGYLELLEPLGYGQVAPILYVWIQLTIVNALGFNEWTLRLFAFVCGVASLLLFQHLAKRLLAGAAYVWAVALFAVAYPLFRYSTEAKPYSSDVLVSLVLVTLAVRWWQTPAERRWAWLLIAVTPVCVFLSYPSVFVGGGVSLALAAALYRERDVRGGLLWAAYSAVLVGSFAALFFLFAGKQMAAAPHMLDFWAKTFPPTDSVSSLFSWLVYTHTSDALAYPVGGPRYASTLTFIWCLCGLVLLWERKNLPLALLCVGPAVLNLIAAALHKFPYGGHIRLALYAAPFVCLLVGLGATRLLEWIARSERWRSRVLTAGLAAFAALLVAEVAEFQVKPHKTEEYLNARNLAQWFWSDLASKGELVCLETDLDVELTPGLFAGGKSCLYLCNQRIYSPRHAAKAKPDLSKISADWPLLCVEYAKAESASNPARARWLAAMQERYVLRSAWTPLPEAVWDDRGKSRTGFCYWRVYEFVPRRSEVIARTPAAAPQ